MHSLGDSDFEKRIVAAMAEFQNDGGIDGSNTKANISVTAFLKKYRISRSSLYKDHAYLLPRIANFLSLASSKKGEVEKMPSAAALQKQIIGLKKEFKATYSDLASSTLAQLVSECGPAFRSRTQLVLECQQRDRQILELETIISNQANIIQSLMAQLNSRV